MPTHDQKVELKQKVTRLVAEKFGGDWNKMFVHYDLDGDGCWNRSEIVAMLDDADVGLRMLRMAWANGIIDELDKDLDGKLSRAELAASLNLPL